MNLCMCDSVTASNAEVKTGLMLKAAAPFTDSKACLPTGTVMVRFIGNHACLVCLCSRFTQQLDNCSRFTQQFRQLPKQQRFIVSQQSKTVLAEYGCQYMHNVYILYSSKLKPNETFRCMSHLRLECPVH